MRDRDFRDRAVVHRWSKIPTWDELLYSKIGSLYVIPLGLAIGLGIVIIPLSIVSLF